MDQWLKVSLMLCTFGFFREYRPSEPFVFEFMSGPWRNISAEVINREIYPMGTYFYLGLLVVVFLITDMLRYKPIIVLSAISGICLWAILLWTITLRWLYVTQFFYGFFMAAEVAYYTYIYAKVERRRYQQVTGHTRSAILTGRFLAGTTAQLLVSFELMDFRDLNYISFGSQIVSLFISIVLPSVGVSMYFYARKAPIEGVQVDSSAEQKHDDTPESLAYTNHAADLSPEDDKQSKSVVRRRFEEDVDVMKSKAESESAGNGSSGRAAEDVCTADSSPIKDVEEKIHFSCQRATALLWQHFIAGYSNRTVFQWSLWWALAMCGFLQVQTYIQPLWQQIDDGRETFWNGAVEAALTLLGAISALLAGSLNARLIEKWDLWILTICSAVEGALILGAAFTQHVIVAYVLYVLFGTLYHFMITIASATVAKYLVEDSFALIFGINTMFALLFQTIMTIIVISDVGFALDPRGQFQVFGWYFVCLAAIFGVTGLVKIINRKCCGKTFQLTAE
ncbi:thiamine transporter 2-like [Phlebotomus argentipes]|uniref:thiamine transporter 2-like n=1 Tax=Phlebotomus argentipes TaxID=94469 RepID=UPI002892AA3F|nr:thiamine transporter 2-like [Phlebotomus argentipes]